MTAYAGRFIDVCIFEGRSGLISNLDLKLHTAVCSETSVTIYLNIWRHFPQEGNVHRTSHIALAGTYCSWWNGYAAKRPSAGGDLRRRRTFAGIDTLSSARVCDALLLDGKQTHSVPWRHICCFQRSFRGLQQDCVPIPHFLGWG
jgi:hypothetical protein